MAFTCAWSRGTTFAWISSRGDPLNRSTISFSRPRVSIGGTFDG
jgi:hypothetical protein